MPPRLSILSALRASVESINSRAFSSTAAVALPPREAPSAHPHHPTSSQQPSSTSSLLSLNRPNRRIGPKDRGAGVSVAEKMVSRAKERAEADLQAQQANQDLRREEQLSKAYLREMPRFWKVGDVYSPHDLSPVEMQKWRRRAERRGDIIDALGINPLDMYKNFSAIAEFTRSSGQIMHSRQTGLRPVNQRKLAKMIRRAQGMGIYPSIHNHPEMIRDQFYPPGL
ncbi:unnamed protein product [Clonostachys rhizophaga]|uniref:Small ribosomal subunit protein bS18m n=1 Tax=Clonostachys rhizophaga TaxID=160324 RepID=A0A9N9V817_9HYPO|nr:unnamed protein product [Clonostachys rhizophaga]